jgi:hypothetical protein
MVLRYRAVHRLTGLMVRWGIIDHPYGQEYAKQRYTFTGRRRPDTTFDSDETVQTRGGVALVVAGLVLASLLATGLLFAL